MKFCELPEGKKFQLIDGKDILLATKVARTKHFSGIGIPLHNGNAVLFGGTPSTGEVGDLMMVPDDKEIVQL